MISWLSALSIKGPSTHPRHRIIRWGHIWNVVTIIQTEWNACKYKQCSAWLLFYLFFVHIPFIQTCEILVKLNQWFKYPLQISTQRWMRAHTIHRGVWSPFTNNPLFGNTLLFKHPPQFYQHFMILNCSILVHVKQALIKGCYDYISQETTRISH